MRALPSALCACLCLLSWGSVSAQQTTSTSGLPATSDPQSVALLQQVLTNLVGGASISDVTLTGSANRIAGSDNETGTATVTAMNGGYSKLNLSFPSGPRSEIRNPAGTPLATVVPAPAPPTGPQPVGGWSGPDGVLHPTTGDNLMTDATWFFPAFTVGNILSSQTYVLSYIGPETLSGQAVVHVSATRQFTDLSNAPAQVTNLLQHLSRLEVYLDSTTLLPVALAFNLHPDGNALVDIPTEIQFSNYTTVSGARIPLHVQKYLNNGLTLDLQFGSVTLNSGLTTAQFQFQ